MYNLINNKKILSSCKFAQKNVCTVLAEQWMKGDQGSEAAALSLQNLVGTMFTVTTHCQCVQGPMHLDLFFTNDCNQLPLKYFRQLLHNCTKVFSHTSGVCV